MQCNKIREIKQHDDIVVTHSDVAEVFVWDFAKVEEGPGVRVRPCLSRSWWQHGCHQLCPTPAVPNSSGASARPVIR
jgi:hypothetical protein